MNQRIHIRRPCEGGETAERETAERETAQSGLCTVKRCKLADVRLYITRAGDSLEESNSPMRTVEDLK